MPTDSRNRVSSLPAAPINGLPVRSSSFPGASPTRNSVALAGPSPRTRIFRLFSLYFHIEHFELHRQVIDHIHSQQTEKPAHQHSDPERRSDQCTRCIHCVPLLWITFTISRAYFLPSRRLRFPLRPITSSAKSLSLLLTISNTLPCHRSSHTELISHPMCGNDAANRLNGVTSSVASSRHGAEAMNICLSDLCSPHSSCPH